MSGRVVETRLPLHVVAHGKGRPLLLVHGFGASRFSWRHWTPELATDHRVLEVDLRGFGDAPAPRDGRYSTLDEGRLLRDLVLEKGLEDATLVGHSWGAAVVLVAALDLHDAAPGSVTRLVLVSGSCFPQTLPRFISLAGVPLLGRALLRVLPKRALIRRILKEIVHDPSVITSEMVEGYARPLRRAGTRRAILRAATRLDPPGSDAIIARYPDLDLPTLLLWGREDPVVPLSLGRRLHDTLPRAHLHVLEACGHAVPDERPRESVTRVREFLADGVP